MTCKPVLIMVLALGWLASFGQLHRVPTLTVAYPAGAQGPERLAAQELQRYLYLRTGALPPLQALGLQDALPPASILVSSAAHLAGLRAAKAAGVPAALTGDSYRLQSLTPRQLLIVGGTEVAVLYGAYKFLESTGIGFALHDDIIPDKQVPTVAVAGFHKTYTPAFALRGLQPFHDFAEGPDWWNEDDYEAIIAQLPKLGMNFIGFHTYPEANPFAGWYRAEPLVWIGPAGQFRADGTVQLAYPALHATTADSTWWYHPRQTSDFSFGAAQLFEVDAYGADYMQNVSPWPHTLAENVAIFDKVGALLKQSFTLAHRLGVKTCVGTEAPLQIPTQVKAYLRAQHQDPESEAVKQALYAGTFARIKAAYPLDYYWLWTPENWTWQGEKAEAVESIKSDLRSAVAAAHSVQAPFTLATCGWVLGPTRNRAEFDHLLPKKMPFGVINRLQGATPVEPAFQTIRDRPKWQISWLEDDPALTSPQLWAGRIAKDAADAYRYGCTGFMGIHWRTKGLAPALQALAQAGWEAQTYTRPLAQEARDYPVADLYATWASHEFGTSAGAELGPVFARLDGGPQYEGDQRNIMAIRTNLPRPSYWGPTGGPGKIMANPQPWRAVEPEFAFIQAVEKARPLVEGPSAQERYQYWLNTFYYTREQAHVGCLLGEMNATRQQLRAAPAASRPALARQLLAQRTQAGQQWTRMVYYLLQTVSTTGEMGTLANLEQHNLGSQRLLTQYDSLLTASLGTPVPSLNLAKTYDGPSRLVVTTRRTLLRPGEDLTLKVRVLTPGAVASSTVFWKPLGRGNFQAKPLGHVGRNVYDVALAHEQFKNSAFEYYIETKLQDGQKLRYPAGTTCRAVVVW